jgi:hypothetical protein
MHRTVSVLVAVVALVAAAALVTSQNEPTETLMRAKAGYAHRLLDAVVQEDFDVIQDQAFRLKAVAETADWYDAENPELERETHAFIRAADRLFEAAKDKNGDGAALAYMNVTLSCVHCHRLLRTQ